MAKCTLRQPPSSKALAKPIWVTAEAALPFPRSGPPALSSQSRFLAPSSEPSDALYDRIGDARNKPGNEV
jgi:hypothetical protein